MCNREEIKVVKTKHYRERITDAREAVRIELKNLNGACANTS